MTWPRFHLLALLLMLLQLPSQADRRGIFLVLPVRLFWVISAFFGRRVKHFFAFFKMALL
jgi:hypothetical protein